VLIGETSATVHTLAGDRTSKAADIAPRLSAARFVQKSERSVPGELIYLQTG